MPDITSKVRIAFTMLDAHEPSEYFGIAGSWFFDAKVKIRPTNAETTLGSINDRFEVYEGTHLDFDDTWAAEIDVAASDLALEISFEGKDDDLIFDDDLGKIRAVINLPLHQNYLLTLRSSDDFFSVTLAVTVLESDTVNVGSITTVVENSDSEAYNSIHIGVADKFVHINPVIPVPWSTGVPPIPAPISLLTASPQIALNAPFGSTALNALVNPSFIPIISTTHSDFNNRIARIKITQYWPSTLDLSKLIWRIRSPNIKFWNGSAGVTEIKGGDEVKVYGVASAADSEVYIEVRYDEAHEPLLARYRAWVGTPKQITYRAVIVKTTKSGSLNPSVTASNIDDHIEFTNIILWQAGIRLIPDTDTSTGTGTTHIRDAIFEYSSAQDYTFSQNTDTSPAAVINARSGVFNLSFMHSDAPGTLLGAATDRGLSADETFITLGGTPSSSWVRPTGVFPDDPAEQIRMRTMGPSTRQSDVDDGTLSQSEFDTMKALTADNDLSSVSGCLITDSYISSKNLDGTQRYFRTLAHELGHVIGLHHRGSGWSDSAPSSNDRVDHKAGPNSGRGHPWDNNFMTYGPHPQSQDLDIIQCMHIRSHPLVSGSAPTPTPPTPTPVKTIPDAYYPTEADRILLQEYLIHKQSGLQHGPYDIGSSGAGADGVDGIVGSKTKDGVKQFQQDHGGLSADGIYGPNTRSAFDTEINGTS